MKIMKFHINSEKNCYRVSFLDLKTIIFEIFNEFFYDGLGLPKNYSDFHDFFTVQTFLKQNYFIPRSFICLKICK